jgi:hypothetical protein
MEASRLVVSHADLVSDHRVVTGNRPCFAPTPIEGLADIALLR